MNFINYLNPWMRKTNFHSLPLDDQWHSKKISENKILFEAIPFRNIEVITKRTVPLTTGNEGKSFIAKWEQVFQLFTAVTIALNFTIYSLAENGKSFVQK